MPLRNKKKHHPKPEHLSKRRLVENEALARRANEKVQKAVEDTFNPDERANLRLHFYCECANYNCQERITLSPDDYKKIHRNRRRFIVRPGHEQLKVERIIDKHPQHVVIEKIVFPGVRGLLRNPLNKNKKSKAES